MKYCLLLIIFFSVIKGKTQQPKLILPVGHTTPPIVEFNKKGNLLLSKSKEKLLVWDVKMGKILYDLTPTAINSFDAEFNSEGNKLIVYNENCKLKILNLESGNVEKEFFFKDNPIETFSFTIKGDKFISGHKDSSLRLWNIAAKNEISTIKLEGLPKRIIADLMGKTALVFYDSTYFKLALGDSGLEDDTIRYEIHKSVQIDFNSKQIFPYEGNTNFKEKSNYCVSNDLSLVASSNKEGTINILDKKRNLKRVLKGFSSLITSSYLDSANRRLITVNNYKNIKSWDLSTGSLAFSLRDDSWCGTIESFYFCNSLKTFIISQCEGMYSMHNSINGEKVEIEKDSCFSAINRFTKITHLNNRLDNTTSYDIRVINTANDSVIFSLSSYTADYIVKSSLNNMGDKLLVLSLTDASSSNFVQLWDVMNKKLIKKLYFGNNEISNISFSNDDKYIFICTKSNKTTILYSNSLEPIIEEAGSGVLDLNNDVIGITDNTFFTLYNIEQRKKMIDLIAIDTTDFIAITSEGYYTGSKKALSKIHYVKGSKIITFEQLDIKYNRPDKVLEAIGNTDTALINSFRKAYQKRIKKLGIDTTQFKDGYSVPESDFINRDAIEYEQTKDKLILKIKAVDSTYKLERFNVWVNEVPIFGLRGSRIKPKNIFDTTVTIILSQGENRIEASVINANGTESYRMPLFVKYSPAILKEPKLHFIGIGINQFANPDYNLNWSVKDIRDLALKLKTKYPDIIIDTLFDNNLTKENVLALKQKLLQLKEDDKVIVSYSGHGVLSKDFDYYLSTYSINFNTPEEKGLAYDDLENLLDNIKPRQKLMLIDACHSGEVDKEEIAKIEIAKNELAKNGVSTKSTIKVIPKKNIGMANSFELMQSLFVNVGKGTGATIISAAGGMQYAQERGDLKNGVFTYSIIEAFNQNTTLKVSELKKKVGERVTQLTNGLQKPTSRNETNNYDWVIW